MWKRYIVWKKRFRPPISLPRIANERVIEFILEPPGIIEIVFRAGSMQRRRKALAVDEPHVVPFSPPTRGETLDVQHHAHQLTSTYRIHEDIIVFPVIDSMGNLAGNRPGGILPPPLRMKPALIGSCRGIGILLVVDMVKKFPDFLRPFVR